jgi:hypothetical protein
MYRTFEKYIAFRISASSWFEYVNSATCNYYTLEAQILYISHIKIWKLFKLLSCWYHDCLNIANDRHNLRNLRNSVYYSSVLGSLNSEAMHFWTYVDIYYFYCLHMWNSFMKSCRVFKHPVYIYIMWWINKTGCLNKILSITYFVSRKRLEIIYIYTYNIYLGPGVYSASNRNEYRKHKNNNVSGE